MPLLPHVLRTVAVMVTLVLLGIALVGGASPARAAERPEVVADDSADTIVGTGGLVLPGSVDEGLRSEVAGCPGCAWRVTSPCVESVLGNAFDGQEHCRSVTRGCQVGSLRRTWFRPEVGGWRELGLMCLRERPVTIAMVGERIEERLEKRLPSPTLRHVPTSGVVTGIPTAFAVAADAGPRVFEWEILGQRVTVTATPTWTWTFPDGTLVRTREPGRPDRDSPVSHTFRRAGRMEVICEAEWTGEYVVPGLGRFPVEGLVRQQSRLLVPVGEGRALLTS